jgi:hypothetical protein
MWAQHVPGEPIQEEADQAAAVEELTQAESTAEFKRAEAEAAGKGSSAAPNATPEAEAAPPPAPDPVLDREEQVALETEAEAPTGNLIPQEDADEDINTSPKLLEVPARPPVANNLQLALIPTREPVVEDEYQFEDYTPPPSTRSNSEDEAQEAPEPGVWKAKNQYRGMEAAAIQAQHP